MPSCATTASSSRSPSAKRMGSATSIRPGQLVLTLRRQTPLLHRRHEGDRADLRRREALGPNPTAARFWVSIDSEPDPFLDGLREGVRAFPPPAKVTKPSALFIRQPGRGRWRNTNRVTSLTVERLADRQIVHSGETLLFILWPHRSLRDVDTSRESTSAAVDETNEHVFDPRRHSALWVDE